MIKIVEANEGQKISHSVNKNWLNIGDQIMLNLKSVKQTTTSISTLLRTNSGRWEPDRGFTMWPRWIFRPDSTQKPKLRIRTTTKKNLLLQKLLSNAKLFRSLLTT